MTERERERGRKLGRVTVKKFTIDLRTPSAHRACMFRGRVFPRAARCTSGAVGCNTGHAFRCGRVSFFVKILPVGCHFAYFRLVRRRSQSLSSSSSPSPLSLSPPPLPLLSSLSSAVRCDVLPHFAPSFCTTVRLFLPRHVTLVVDHSLDTSH